MAIANKLARIAWAVLSSGKNYQHQPLQMICSLMAVEKTLRLESAERFPLFHRHDGELELEPRSTTVCGAEKETKEQSNGVFGKPGGDNASLVTERFIRTDTCGSSSSVRRAILHQEAGYIYADCPFVQLQTSCSPAADHTFSPTRPEAVVSLCQGDRTDLLYQVEC